ncbi:hypothetical protein [Longispora sp. NPDC051575]|uniref:hypothetical protein n=1 Tax=Longispora sp. NPDC051575 TaxID=3154943 RepID=UPI00343445CB
MQVTHTTFLPLLRQAKDAGDSVADDFGAGLVVAYTFGPPYGERPVTWGDIDQLGWTHCRLRTEAAGNLVQRLDRLRVHGKSPAFMLSFDGLESSLLTADHEIWDQLAGAVTGELVVGVPARDVVVVTGTGSPSGLDKARRTVDRVFFAGDENLLSPELLVRRPGGWEPL